MKGRKIEINVNWKHVLTLLLFIPLSQTFLIIYENPSEFKFLETITFISSFLGIFLLLSSLLNKNADKKLKEKKAIKTMLDFTKKVIDATNDDKREKTNFYKRRNDDDDRREEDEGNERDKDVVVYKI